MRCGKLRPRKAKMRMPKLFVAIDLPSSVTAALVRIQPSAMTGIRLVEPSQMHVTLHYLGEADIERIAAALQAVIAPSFPLAIEGVGQFPSADGAVTLWAGVRQSPELLGLHAAVASALARQFRPESRPYAPH